MVYLIATKGLPASGRHAHRSGDADGGCPAHRQSPDGIAQLITDRVVYWDRLASAGMLVLLPPVIFGIAVQKYLVTGFTGGAVKGG
jgi:hypothetical protein